MLWQAWHMPCLDFSNFPQPVKKLKPAGRISIYLLAGNIYFGRSIKDCHACDFASDTPMTAAEQCRLILEVHYGSTVQVYEGSIADSNLGIVWTFKSFPPLHLSQSLLKSQMK